MNPLNHVAIIMDGNGRWGLKHKNTRNEGHKAGLKTVEKIIKETINQKINSNILGGFILKLDDKMYDASYRTKLKNIKKTLLNN